jgi:hypothetical protein
MPSLFEEITVRPIFPSLTILTWLRFHRVLMIAIAFAAISLGGHIASATAECVHSKGYWKNHPSEVTVTSLTLGSVSYDVSQLMAILHAPAKGNGLIILSQQLIAAKLNATIATVPIEIQAAISGSDSLIGALVVPPVGTGSLQPSQTSGLAGLLDQYNNGDFPCEPLVDTDGDGLYDSDEVNIHHTDPSDADTDNDNLSDGDEVQTLGTNPLVSDTDGDGLIDGDELFAHITNPLDADTDGDGLSDGAEVLTHGTNPLDGDSDHDGVSDGDEVNIHTTGPNNPDSDGDGLSDGQEILTHNTNPNVADHRW